MELSFFEALQFAFMARAVIAVTILALAAGIVGLGISLREFEFVSDGLVHAIFPGLVIGVIVGGSAALLPGALVAALIAAVLITLLQHRGGAHDTTIAVVLTGLFSLGVVLVSRQRSYVAQMQELLFGHLLTVTSEQLWQIGCITVLAIVVMGLSMRAQLFRAFDPVAAEAAGYRSLRTDLALTTATALVVVAGVQALGVLMVIALLIVPMATARLLTRRLWWLVPIAVVVAMCAGLLGLWWSFRWSVGYGVSVSPGALVVLLLVASYLLAIAFRMLWARIASRRGEVSV